MRSIILCPCFKSVRIWKRWNSRYVRQTSRESKRGSWSRWAGVAVRQRHRSVERASSSGGTRTCFALENENLFQNILVWWVFPLVYNSAGSHDAKGNVLNVGDICFFPSPLDILLPASFPFHPSPWQLWLLESIGLQNISLKSPEKWNFLIWELGRGNSNNWCRLFLFIVDITQ